MMGEYGKGYEAALLEVGESFAEVDEYLVDLLDEDSLSPEQEELVLLRRETLAWLRARVFA